jgi:hypothetical protein
VPQPHRPGSTAADQHAGGRMLHLACLGVDGPAPSPVSPRHTFKLGRSTIPPVARQDSASVSSCALEHAWPHLLSAATPPSCRQRPSSRVGVVWLA